jgi:hypothetical protein
MTVHRRPQSACSPSMQFDCDHPSPSRQEWQSESARAGPKVDNDLAGPDGRASNDLLSPVRIQPVPAPWLPPGHDAP